MGIQPAEAVSSPHSPQTRNPYNTPLTAHLDEKWTFLDEEPGRTLSDVIATEPTDTFDIIFDLMKRVLGEQHASVVSYFALELIVAKPRADSELPAFLSKRQHAQHPVWNDSLYLDVMQLDSNASHIILRGSSTIALAVAFNWYLESYCNTTYDWRTYSIELPASLPMPTFKQKTRVVPFSYYENVCTVSYTQAFWGWDEWEPHLDWMAMQGINLPLAFTGQEYIFSKTFYAFNFTQADLQQFFSGPGFFAWQRMGNLRGWGGPISQACIVQQYNLQLQILSRMYTFGMKPALTAFAGHVPSSITSLYPSADTSFSPNWWGSPSEYCCDLLLNFSDPLFAAIGSAFIEQQTKYFGTSHIYQCDTFNEMDPPTSDAAYLKSATASIYASIAAVDSSAVWLMQGWLFQYHGFWTQDAVANYLGGVADDALIVLDLYDDVSPQYNNFDSFYGKPFVWNTLHNFGGNQGMLGTLYNVANGVTEALQYEDSTVIGVGITMEGIWQNYVVYDETLKTAFDEVVEVDEFVKRYAVRRYGLPYSSANESVSEVLIKAWQVLAASVYNVSHWGGVTKSLWSTMPKLDGVHSGFMPTELLYDATQVMDVWRMFVQVADEMSTSVEKFRYDLIDVSRQAMSDLFLQQYQVLNESYYNNDVDGVTKGGAVMMQLIADVDELLNTDRLWMLGEWIQMARKLGETSDEQDWWEWNARNQITLWGPDGEINNYASKTWGGLLATYHAPQWKLFVDELVTSMTAGVAFNQTAFVEKNMKSIAQPWQHATNVYPMTPVNDTVLVAKALYAKWGA